MPPKAKFTREYIVSTALEFVRANGFDQLTARALGDALGSSPRPIFTVFDSMEEVQGEVFAAARALYAGYVEKGLACEIAFKGVGEQYIKFAIDEPKLFMLLFMREQPGVPDINSVLGVIDESAEKILMSVVNGYGVDIDIARRLYSHLWVYTHGIATAIATKVCRFSSGEISEMMSEVFVGVFKELTTRGNSNDKGE